VPSTQSSRRPPTNPGVLLVAVELERRRRRQAGESGPRFYGAAREVLDSRLPELVISGPAGTGKSYACLCKLHNLASSTPGFRGLILRKTRESLTTTGLVTFEEQVLGHGHWMVRDGPQRRNRQSYVYPNGSEITVGGMDKPGKVLSSDFDVIYVQQAEEFAENDWEILAIRCRNAKLAYQQIIGDCNPDRPTHWLRARATKSQTPMLESKHQDNPRLWDRHKGEWTAEGRDYVLGRLEKLTGVRRERFLLGLWSATEGAVYETWDRSVHVRTLRETIGLDAIPNEWRRIRVVDFGYTNPFVCQWWVIDPDGRAIRYREIYRTQRLVEDHAKDINRLSVYPDGTPEKIETTVCDPEDAEGRATLEKAGIPTVAAYKAKGSVKAGIQLIEARLRPAGDGKPRLRYLSGALVESDQALVTAGLPFCTEQEYDGYVWAKSSDGKPNKEEPVDKDNHGLDASRYLAGYLDGLGGGDPVPGWVAIVNKYGRPT